MVFEYCIHLNGTYLGTIPDTGSYYNTFLIAVALANKIKEKIYFI
jgi:hypothetical protein